MEKVAEHFGLGFLALIAGTLVVKLFATCIQPGGVLNNIILNYMNSICGRI